MPTGTPKSRTVEAVRNAITALCPRMSFADPTAGSQRRILNEFNALRIQTSQRALETLRRLLEAVRAANE